MGAFFLSHISAVIDNPRIDLIYQKKGFKSLYYIQIGEYKLKLFRKQILDLPNYFQYNGNYIFVCGSLFYKGLSYKDSISQLLSDFLSNKLENEKLYGNYAIIFYTSSTKEIVFATDPAHIKNIYFDSKNKIITTDFLALINSSENNYTLNKLALIENITTGHLISPDTYANEIEKLDKVNFKSIEPNFPGIRIYDLTQKVNNTFLNRKDAIKHANTKLSDYFQSVAKLTDEFGAHIGLTGGFDSRLLLMHARKHIKKLITNSFWRPNSAEFFHAKVLAKVAGIKFASFEKDHFQLPIKEVMLEKSYYFFDGQIRSQNNWDQEFNLPEYAEKIAFGHFVGFHGCGGEQYRNADRFIKQITVKAYIQHEWMFKQCVNVFIDDNLQTLVYDNINKKIRRLAYIKRDKIGLEELKKIQNEIWNTANRTTRINVLNQQQFYFAPFTEFQLSHAAYDYIPYLGNSLSFQIELMKELDIELAAVKSNYSFDISKGETFIYHLIPYLFNMLPRSIFYFLYFKLRKLQTNKFPFASFFENSHSFFSTLKSSIDFEKLSKSNSLGNSLSSFDILLKRLNPK